MQAVALSGYLQKACKIPLPAGFRRSGRPDDSLRKEVYSPPMTSPAQENSASVARPPDMQAASAPPVSSPASLGLLLGGAALVFGLMIGLLAVASIDRNEDAMSRLLAEKGATLVDTLESMLRLGLRSKVGIPLQSLLDTMGDSSDVRFIAVTMPDGTILAHSQRNRRGEILLMDGQEMDEKVMAHLNPGKETQWAFMNMEGRPVFVVYRQFMPPPPELAGRFPIPVLFLGLDVSPFDIIRRQDRDYLVILASGSLLVGLVALVALYYAQRARQSRRGQRLAEGQVRRLEEEVRRKEKLAAVGTLAAGVAHEIRNPLSSIKGYATYFGQRFPEDSEDRKAAQVMVREVDRLNRVITDLIGLSRPTDVRARPARLEQVAEHVLRLIKQDAANHGVTLSCTAAPHLPPALVDPDRLGQALLNVCLNALDALQTEGASAQDGQARLQIHVSREGRMLRLDVTDNGEGIAPENLRHIFDPYFTTKGHGTGLGLATVHKIVEAHGGDVSIRSRRAEAGRRGETVVSIRLPVADAAAQPGGKKAEKEQA